MYIEELPNPLYTSTIVKIKYDCHGEERSMKWCDAKKNFEKNDGKHICRPCWLRSDANPAKQKEVQEKIKKTNQERYGDTLPINTPERITARSKKYEDKAFVEETLAKRRETNLEKYGVDHPMKNDEVKERQQGVFMDRYGVKAPLQSPDILAKMQRTVLERHGVENVAQLFEVQDRMAATSMDRYGVKHYNQLPEMRDYLRENCKGWLAESYASGGPNKGIVRPEEWNQKQSETVANLVVAGLWKGGDKGKVRGHIEAIKCKKSRPFFRSSLELLVHLHVNHEESVEYYDYEPFFIVYMDEFGHSRRYTPDFLIKFKNDPQVYLIEVKPGFLHVNTAVKLKTDAGKQYSRDNSMVFEIWDENKVRSLAQPPTGQFIIEFI